MLFKKIVSVAFVVLLCGCGEKDLNKDFKPTSADTPMPSAAGSGAAAPTSAPTPP